MIEYSHYSFDMKIGVLDTEIYGNEELLPGEKVIGQLRQHWITLVSASLLFAFLFLVPFFWYWFARNILALEMNHAFLWIVFVITCLIPLLFFLASYINYKFNGVLITNKRFFVYDFYLFFISNSDIFPLSHIYELLSTPESYLLKYNAVDIVISPSKESVLSFHHVDNRNGIIDTIQDEITRLQVESKKGEDQ